jgi:hypothetical protein
MRKLSQSLKMCIIKLMLHFPTEVAQASCITQAHIAWGSLEKREPPDRENFHLQHALNDSPVLYIIT